MVVGQQATELRFRYLVQVTTPGRQYGGRAVAARRLERRQRFLNSAITVFADLGYANCSIGDVCSAAGLSRRQFYEEFDSREDLLISVYDRITEESECAVRTAAATLLRPLGARDAATELLTAYLCSVGSDPQRAKVIFVEVIGVSDRVERHRHARRIEWSALFDRTIMAVVGPHARLFGGSDMAASAFIGAVHGLAYEWLQADPRPTIARLAEVLAPILVALTTD